MYKYILFDLDGTITDPFSGITSSVKFSLDHYGIKCDSLEELKPFIGPPLRDSYMKYYGFSYEKATEAIVWYRKYYADRGIFECVLYDGIKELLESLSKDFKLILATSKPQEYAERILEKFDIGKYFYHTVGASMDEKFAEKWQIIEKALCDVGAGEKDAVMIGDRSFDIDGAKKSGIDAVGVTYGYGSREEFDSADFIAENVSDLKNFLYKE